MSNVKIGNRGGSVRIQGKPSFVQKIAREWNRFTKRGISARWLVQRIRGMSDDEYAYHTWRKNVVIRKDGRVSVGIAGWSVCDKCNLRCEFCGNAIPFRSGDVSKDTLIDSFEKWSQKIVPRTIVLAGGEPLLNPDISEIVVAARHYWPESECHLTTNGILLSRIHDDILQCFQKHNAILNISQHMDTEEYRNTLQQVLLRLKQFRISHTTLKPYLTWRKHPCIDVSGVPTPCHSSPKTAYGNCSMKMCTYMHGDYLHRCGHLGVIFAAISEDALAPEWNRVLTHKPVTCKSSPQEIRDYLLGGPMPECSVCPEKYEIVESRQLSTIEVQQIKSHIQQRRQRA